MGTNPVVGAPNYNPGQNVQVSLSFSASGQESTRKLCKKCFPGGDLLKRLHCLGRAERLFQTMEDQNGIKPRDREKDLLWTFEVVLKGNHLGLEIQRQEFVSDFLQREWACSSEEKWGTCCGWRGTKEGSEGQWDYTNNSSFSKSLLHFTVAER